MKKFFSLAIAFVAIMGMSVNAQTVESSRFIDNTYITLKGGASALTHPGCNDYKNFGHSIQGQAALEFGKWITPKFGVGIEGTVGFDNGSRPWGVENTVGWFQGRNWVNHVDVLALAKFNMNNIIHGYKGYADKVEVVPTVGIGWTHGWTYAYNDEMSIDNENGIIGTQHENNIMTKYAIDVNINLTNRWQINVEPFYAFNLTGSKFSSTRDAAVNDYPHFDSRNSWWGLNVGVTYKIGKQFTLCPYKYTQADIDRLNAEINDLRNRKPEVVTKVETVEKIVTKTVNDADQFVVFFANASTVLTDDAKATLNEIGENSIVNVIGSASPDGNANFNANLANERAEVVKNYLENRGVRVNDAHGVGTDLGARVAVVVIK